MRCVKVKRKVNIIKMLAIATLLAIALPRSIPAQVSLSEYRTIFWIKAYIPSRHPVDSDLIFESESGSKNLKAPQVAPGFGVAGKCFSTDNRLRSPNISALARIHHQFTVVTKGRKLTIENNIKIVGESHLVDCASGNILDSKRAPKSDMRMSVDKTSNREYRITLKASSGNPFFVVKGHNVAPKIDWDIYIVYDIFSRSFKIDYSHGCFPAFEMYAKPHDEDTITVVFQNDIMNSCSPFNLVDLNLGINTVKGSWGPYKIRDLNNDTSNIFR